MTLVTLERIEGVAPDQASLNAAKKLMKPGKWPGLFVDRASELVWGECQGSGAAPYRMAVALHDLGAKCSCPSRKFPCKHSIALMWWRVEEADRFVEADIPEWVSEWLSRRRPSGKRDDQQGEADAPTKSARAASEQAEVPRKEPDPIKRAKQRERNRAAREKRILAGLDELDLWIADQLEQGFGAFSLRAGEQCKLLSRRLVDAKAGGLATRVEALSSSYFQAEERGRNRFLMQELGELHLLAEAYRRQEELDPALRLDVRRLVGWTTTRAELLEDESALRVAGAWCVLATTRTNQVDRLIRCETWLALLEAREADSSNEAPPYAVLRDYVPAASASGWAPPAVRGDVLVGELVFHPSASPCAAIFSAQDALADATVDREFAVPASSSSLDEALDAYDFELAKQPWLGPRILAARAVVRESQQGGLWIGCPRGDVGLPIHSEHAEACAALLSVGTVSLHSLFDGRSVVPLVANTELGPWWNEAL